MNEATIYIVSGVIIGFLISVVLTVVLTAAKFILRMMKKWTNE